jgi:hypothetical protein
MDYVPYIETQMLALQFVEQNYPNYYVCGELNWGSPEKLTSTRSGFVSKPLKIINQDVIGEKAFLDVGVIFVDSEKPDPEKKINSSSRILTAELVEYYCRKSRCASIYKISS